MKIIAAIYSVSSTHSLTIMASLKHCQGSATESSGTCTRRHCGAAHTHTHTHTPKGSAIPISGSWAVLLISKCSSSYVHNISTSSLRTHCHAVFCKLSRYWAVKHSLCSNVAYCCTELSSPPRRHRKYNSGLNTQTVDKAETDCVFYLLEEKWKAGLQHVGRDRGALSRGPLGVWCHANMKATVWRKLCLISTLAETGWDSWDMKVAA